MAPSVRLLAEGEALLPVGFVGNDRCRSAVAEPFAQRVAVVSAISEKLLGKLRTTDQALSWRTVMCLASAQEDGKKTTFSICHCMDFRIAPAA